jgi:beta-lactamase class A
VTAVAGHLSRLALDRVPGAISVWFGPPGGPSVYARAAELPHYAASLMKLPVLLALHRSGALDHEVRIVNEFGSARPGSPRYALQRRHDSDPIVWERLGERVPAHWLAHHMITRSSNLAANLLLEQVGVATADAVWPSVGGTGSRVQRGIGDSAAEEAGLTNTVSAADAARLLAAATQAELAPLLDQERNEDLAAGLPSGTRVAHKNGWIRGVRHAAGIVWPDDARPFLLAVCATTPLAANRPDDGACRLIRRIAAAAWADRHAATSWYAT